jgi:hypothetical protein
MRQIRNTLEDTLDADNELSTLIDEKIKGTPYFTSDEDRREFRALVARAFLGAGSSKGQRKIEYNIKIPCPPFYRLIHLPLATNVHQFALRVLAELTGDSVLFSKPEVGVFDIKIPSKELWIRFKTACSEIFPTAQTEALHISKEEHTQREQTFGYQVGGEEEQ